MRQYVNLIEWGIFIFPSQSTLLFHPHGCFWIGKGGITRIWALFLAIFEICPIPYVNEDSLLIDWSFFVRGIYSWSRLTISYWLYHLYIDLLFFSSLSLSLDGNSFLFITSSCSLSFLLPFLPSWLPPLSITRPFPFPFYCLSSLFSSFHDRNVSSLFSFSSLS